MTRIVGDRTQPGDLARIPRDGWDAVVDPSSAGPDEVEAAARHLRNAGRDPQREMELLDTWNAAISS